MSVYGVPTVGQQRRIVVRYYILYVSTTTLTQLPATEYRVKLLYDRYTYTHLLLIPSYLHHVVY